MTDPLVVDGRGVIRAAIALKAPGQAGWSVGRPAFRWLDIKGRIECGVLATGAFLIAMAYILVPLVTALYAMIHTVFAALTIGVAIITEVAFMMVYVIRRTQTPCPPHALPGN